MKIKNIIQESISVKQKVLENETIINTIQEVTDEIVACFKKDGQLLF